jgi:hypothetical protein
MDPWRLHYVARLGATVPLATRGWIVADQRLQHGRLYEFDPAAEVVQGLKLSEIKPVAPKGGKNEQVHA